MYVDVHKLLKPSVNLTEDMSFSHGPNGLDR